MTLTLHEGGDERDRDVGTSVEPAERLSSIASQIKAGGESPRITVRQFLRWFGAYRRGFYKVKAIRAALARAGLITVPDFEGAYIDSEIAFAAAVIVARGEFTMPAPTLTATAVVGSDNAAVADDSAATTSLLGGGVADPTNRISRFAAANNAPLSVKPDSSLQEAVMLMLSYGYSQLPVMQNERVVKGVVSWESIGSRLALGCEGAKVSDFMETHREIGVDVSFFAAIPVIVESQYVLVRGAENKITGIVTTSDLSTEFRTLAEPFLLLGEIENHIRRLIDGKFTLEDVKAARDPSDDSPIESVADLTFGSYVRLLENPTNWHKLHLAVDQTQFVKELDAVRRIRNDVMHFEPEPIEPADLLTLQRFLRLLRTLQDIGAT